MTAANGTGYGRPMLGMIWAQARGGIIGADGAMPWHLPEDLAHFKRVTSGHPVIMGRSTWESLPPRFRPLPGRRNIVLTRRMDFRPDGAIVAHSVASALAAAGSDEPAETAPADCASAAPVVPVEVWVTGGAQVYEAMMPRADVCVITEIDLDVDGDTVAPDPGQGWEAEHTAWRVSERSGLRYRFVTLRRSAPRTL